MASQEAVPDSWDDNPSDPASSLSTPLSHLNINAPTFMPGQNIFAQSFCPVGGPSSELEQSNNAAVQELSSTDVGSQAQGGYLSHKLTFEKYY